MAVVKIRWVLPISDLHNEFEKCLIPADIRDEQTVLALLGDIHSRKGILKWLKPYAYRYAAVLYVLGNHDHYGGQLEGCADNLQQAIDAMYPGNTIHVLQNKSYFFESVYGPVCAFGTTLWTDYNKNNEFVKQWASLNLEDFQSIKKGRRYIQPDDILAEHYKAISFLNAELTELQPGVLPLVLTHHAPSLRSFNRLAVRKQPLCYAYLSELEGFIKKHSIALWLHGHIHQSAKYWLGNTYVYCNPRGYPLIQVNTTYTLTRIDLQEIIAGPPHETA